MITRILTGLSLIAFLLMGLFYLPAKITLLLVALIVMTSLYELWSMFGAKRFNLMISLGAMLLMLALLIAYPVFLSLNAVLILLFACLIY